MKPRFHIDALLSSAHPRKYIRQLRAATRLALRMAAWNVAFIIAGMLLIAIAGEMYFRLTRPFIESSIPIRFVDGVGLIREPNAELRYAHWGDDNFVISRVNSLGFLDREPVSAERAAAGCHIAFIGDSFTEAREVPIADKFHVRLEEMAAREMPQLDITTQAYGITGTGQINQIPFYDEYARRMSPKLVVLVFYSNDFLDNSIALQSVHLGMDPDRMRHMTARRDANGALKLRPPDPEYRLYRLPRRANRWYDSAWKRLDRVSYFAKWLDIKGATWMDDNSSPLTVWADMVAARPCCISLLDGWQPDRGGSLDRPFTEERLPHIFEDALKYTDFGLEQFKRRADRDGARLAILAATEDMGMQGDLQFDRLNAIAEARGIPIISEYGYIVRQEYDAEDGRWRINLHWNATGHQWAAAAVLEWLKENQGVCD